MGEVMSEGGNDPLLPGGVQVSVNLVDYQYARILFQVVGKIVILSIAY